MHITGHMLRPSEQRQQQHPKHNLKEQPRDNKEIVQSYDQFE